MNKRFLCARAFISLVRVEMFGKLSISCVYELLLIGHNIPCRYFGLNNASAKEHITKWIHEKSIAAPNQTKTKQNTNERRTGAFSPLSAIRSFSNRPCILSIPSIYCTYRVSKALIVLWFQMGENRKLCLSLKFQFLLSGEMGEFIFTFVFSGTICLNYLCFRKASIQSNKFHGWY